MRIIALDTILCEEVERVMLRLMKSGGKANLYAHTA